MSAILFPFSSIFTIILSVLLTYFPNVINSCKNNECSFADRFVLVPGPDGSTPISWDDADAACRSSFGSEYGLATVDSEEAQEEAIRICIDDPDNVGQKCWIGLSYGDREYTTSAYDASNWKWSSTGEVADFFTWADGEPTTAGATFFQQYCVYISTEDEDNDWDDYHCAGFDNVFNRNDLIVSSYLCDNPDYSPDKQCLCDCGCCMAEGDPHFTTYVHFCICLLCIQYNVNK